MATISGRAQRQGSQRNGRIYLHAALLVDLAFPGSSEPLLPRGPSQLGVES